jgi:hypothetical protein
MATRTETGTPLATKVAGASGTIEDVAANTGDFLCVVVAAQSTLAPISVAWGNRKMSKELQRIHETPAFMVNFYAIRRVFFGGTRDVTITWSSSIDAKVAFAFTLDSPHVLDEVARSILTASDAPSVGPTDEHLYRDDFCVGVLVAEGGTPDAAPTGITAGWSTGTRVGTAGPPPVSNLTINQYYRQLSNSAGVSLAGSAADARDWVCLLGAFKLVRQHCVDYWGSIVDLGATVDYKGSLYVVVDVFPRRNVLELETVGRVSAVECEVR